MVQPSIFPHRNHSLRWIHWSSQFSTIQAILHRKREHFLKVQPITGSSEWKIDCFAYLIASFLHLPSEGKEVGMLVLISSQFSPINRRRPTRKKAFFTVCKTQERRTVEKCERVRIKEYALSPWLTSAVCVWWVGKSCVFDNGRGVPCMCVKVGLEFYANLSLEWNSLVLPWVERS